MILVDSQFFSCFCSQNVPEQLSGSITDEEVALHRQLMMNFSEIPVKNIRNFSVIAHVDHGKSTLADRLLELTGTISAKAGHKQILDKLQVERERGITVKAQTVSIFYQSKLHKTQIEQHDSDSVYLLNLIDTPGHVDFSNEVTRSLTACDGVILLVDACHGVQAQTVANYHLAKARNLQIVPVINKIDLKHAQPERVSQDLEKLFNINADSVLKISAKLGTGVSTILERIITDIPPPKVNRDAPFRALLFDSWFDRHRGALNLIYVLGGCLKVGQEIQSLQTGKCYPVKSISILRTDEHQVNTM